MKSKLMLATAVAAVGVALALPLSASAHTVLTAHATGGQIVNPAGGDPKGSATFVLQVNRVKQRICFHITFSGIKNVTSANLHKGGPGQIARPIVNFFSNPGSGTVEKGCIRNVKKQIVKRLKQKPSAHYVDIDSQNRPNGAVRGQLTRQ
jgi:pfkB family carbohydrate kinase/CHRD domain